MRVFVGMLVFALSCVPGCEAGPDDPGPPLYYAEGGLMRDADGHVLLLRSINFSGQAKSAEGHLFDFDQSDVDLLLASGINSVRYLTFWKAITPDEAGVVDEAYLSAYVAQVELLADAGLYVVIDMHQDLWGVPFAPHGAPARACPDEVTAGYEPTGAWWTNYTTPQVTGCFDLLWEDEALQQDYITTWQAAAEAVCHRSEVVGFDLMNEPYPGSALFDAEWDNTVLMPFYQRVADAIDAVCPGRLYFVEHSAGFVIGTSEPMVIPAEERGRMVYAGHFYPQEIHEPDGAGYDGDLEAMRERVWNYLGTHVDNTTAIWVGEYGGMSDSNDFAGYIQDLHTIWAGYGASSALWDYYASDGGFAFLDGQGAVKPEFAPVFGTPTPTRLPSAPVVTPDWPTHTTTLDFDCVQDRYATVLLPGADCGCDAAPAGVLDDFPAGPGWADARCLAAAAVTLTCHCGD